MVFNNVQFFTVNRPELNMFFFLYRVINFLVNILKDILAFISRDSKLYLSFPILHLTKIVLQCNVSKHLIKIRI